MHAIPIPDKKELRSFGLLTGLIAAILFGLLLPWLFNFNYPLWPWFIGGVLITVAILFPSALKPVYAVWMRIGLVLGWINTRIILALIFYLLFFPVSLILRVLGKDPMVRTFDPAQMSYRVMRSDTDREHMEKPY